jgi:hypothetical protein
MANTKSTTADELAIRNLVALVHERNLEADRLLHGEDVIRSNAAHGPPPADRKDVQT